MNYFSCHVCVGVVVVLLHASGSGSMIILCSYVNASSFLNFTIQYINIFYYLSLDMLIVRIIQHLHTMAWFSKSMIVASCGGVMHYY